LDIPLHSCIAKEQEHALDNLSGSTGFVVPRARHLLHGRRVDSHPVGRGTGDRCIATVPRPQGCLVHEAKHRGLLLANQESRIMPLINIVIALIVVGVALWLINTYVPMASSIKTILNVVVVIAVAVWVLQGVGLWGQITSYRFNR
jgi:predicted membrane protein